MTDIPHRVTIFFIDGTQISYTTENGFLAIPKQAKEIIAVEVEKI